MKLLRAVFSLSATLLVVACGDKGSGPSFATKSYEIAGYTVTGEVNNGDNVKHYDKHVIVGSVLANSDTFNGISTRIGVLPCKKLGDRSAEEPCPADAARTWADEQLNQALSSRSHDKPMTETVEPVTKYAEHVFGFVDRNTVATGDPGAVDVHVYHSHPTWPNIIQCEVKLNSEQAKHWERLKKSCVELRVSRGG